MLFPIKNIEELEQLNILVSLQNQVQELRLRDKLGEQIYHQDRNELLESMTDAIKNTSENSTKIITETSIKNNKAIENLNKKSSGVDKCERYDSTIFSFFSL